MSDERQRRHADRAGHRANRQQGRGHRPNAPASGSFDLVLEAVAGSALGSSGAPYTLTISAIDLTAVSQPWPAQTLRQAFDAASGWMLSGTGPDYQCSQVLGYIVPGGGPAARWSATRCSSWPPGSARAPRSPRSSTATRSCSCNVHGPFATRIRPGRPNPGHSGAPPSSTRTKAP